MKIKTLTTCFLFALALSSCIRDEALNSEAAIDACVGSDVQMANINADSKVVNVYVHKGADLAKQQLTFTIPFGASLKPSESKAGDTATTYDFSASDHSRNFTVTSEDGNWTATYKVNVVLTEMPLTYHSKICSNRTIPLMRYSTNSIRVHRRKFPSWCNGRAVTPASN